MQLKELKVRGFKSFADEVSFTVDDGLNAIVGPNGCGKSNISDAMRWVLGEQSSRTLRCAKMEDILFNGGSDHKPASVAEVSLTLSNEDGALPLDSPDVTVTRQLHRNGDSKYFLNGAGCLLRDINELFMDTGVGRNAYSLMEQGNIDLILNTRPEERRFLFDEVAGITKYKYRKKETLKRLDKAEQNLVRINDVISELERETEALGHHAEKALEFRERQEGLRTLELELARRQWDGAHSKLAKAEEDLANATVIINEADGKVAALEAAMDKGSLKAADLDSQTQVAQGHVRKFESEVERTESTIALYKERQSNLGQQREDAAGQIDALKEQIERIGKQIEEREREREQLEIQLRLDEGRLTGRQRSLDELTKQVTTAEQEIEDGKATLINMMNEGARIENALSTLENRAEYSETQRARLDASLVSLNRNAEEAELKLDESRRRVKDLDATVAARTAEVTEMTQKLETAQSGVRKLEAEMRGQQDTLAKAVSRVQSLEDLQNAHEGYYLGVRAVLRMHEERPDEIGGICGVVAELIRVESDYETAIETALGAGIQNIVTETAGDAKAAINFLKRHKAGRVTFLPLDILHARSSLDQRVLSYRGIVGWAPDLIDCDPRYRVVVENLLGNVVIAETLDDAITVARRERTRMRLVTLDGEVVNPGGAMSGGSGRSNNAGFLQRPREIEDLKERIGQLSETLGKKEKRRTLLEQQAADAQKTRAEGQEALQKLQIEKAEAAKDLTQVTDHAERVKQEVDVTTSERELLSGEEGDITRERDATQEGLEKLKRERSSLERRVQNIGEQKDATASRRAEIEASVTEMKVDLATRTEKLEGFGAVIKGLDDNRKEAADRAHEFQRAIDNHEEVAKELADKVADAQRSFLMLEQKKFTHAEEVARLERERAELAEEIASKDKELRDVRRDTDRATKRRHNLDVQLTRLRMQERSIAERVQEKYRVAISDIEPNPEVGDNEIEVKEKVQALRGQIESMGAVNLMAIEEYDEHRARLDSLSGDRDDLESARDALLEAIRKINETSRERFLETFELIRVNFSEVFQQLFGGGETELKLTDDEDVLDAGIEIIARPPGKRPQNISMLSGGERSLIAIALLFAVFKIRPSPFYVLDEVDAALDEANVLRFANLIQDYARETQFLIITHNKRTMEKADLLYGVTMEKAGVSKIVSVKFGDDGAEAIA